MFAQLKGLFSNDIGIDLGHVYRHGIGERVESAAGGTPADFDAIVGSRGRGDTQGDERNREQSDHKMFLHSKSSFF